MKQMVIKSKNLLTLFLVAGMHFISCGNSLGAEYEIDVSKTSEVLKGKYQKTTQMQFRVSVESKNPSEVNDDLTAQLFVFSVKTLTKNEILHYSETFRSITFDKSGKYSVESKLVNFADKKGRDHSARDREYKGFVLRLTDGDGQVVATRSTHPDLEQLVDKSLKRGNDGKTKNRRKL